MLCFTKAAGTIYILVQYSTLYDVCRELILFEDIGRYSWEYLKRIVDIREDMERVRSDRGLAKK